MTDRVTWRWGGRVEDTSADSLAVLVTAQDGAGDPQLDAVLAALGAPLAELGEGARPGHGEVWRIPSLGRLPAAEVLFVGVGDEGDGRLAAFEAAAAAGLATREREHVAVAVPAAFDGPELLATVIEGIACGRYRYAGFKTEQAVRPAAVRRVTLTGECSAVDVERVAARAETLAETLAWVRDLTNTPAADLTPSALAAEAERVAASCGIACRIWSTAELADGGFGGVVGVGAASVEPALMAELTYRGGPDDAAPIALVGKGVTFDTGGLDMKPYRSMFSMKDDMAGAAAVLGAIVTAARLRLPLNLVALAPLVENMPGGAPLRPSDVVTHRDGRTTEVVSPDAEGRLILADALAYAAERSPRALLAVSTLTGGTGVGADLWGLMASDRQLSRTLLAAGELAGEPGWELPLWRRYRAYLHSEVADQVNLPPEYPFPISAVVGSVFLDAFVPDTVPWAHLDIGATASRGRLTATAPWQPGATGSPLRALVRWLEAEAEAEVEAGGAR